MIAFRLYNFIKVFIFYVNEIVKPLNRLLKKTPLSKEALNNEELSKNLNT